MSLLEILGLTSMGFCAWFTWWTCTAKDSDTGQSKRASIIEAWVNIAIGLSINYFVNLWIIPLATGGHGVSAANNFWMGWVFTTVSMLRSYTIRRWFNERIHLFARRFGGQAH